MRPVAWHAADAAPLLLAPVPESHKYSRGVLGLRTGSSSYPGAAVLGAEAAWRTGVGLVRYFAPRDDAAPEFGLPSPASAILARRPETVFSHDRDEDRARCDAWLIGSGTDSARRSFSESEALVALLAGSTPVVADAGALDLVASSRLTAPIIVTPHQGEFRTLWAASGLEAAAEGLPAADRASILASHLGATVLLKGSQTVVAAPSGAVYAHGPATPWLASAGTGDVLAGILGALVAVHSKRIRQDELLLAQLGATAALLHDDAARLASGDRKASGSGGPITALDVAEAVPRAVAALRG